MPRGKGYNSPKGSEATSNSGDSMTMDNLEKCRTTPVRMVKGGTTTKGSARRISGGNKRR